MFLPDVSKGLDEYWETVLKQFKKDFHALTPENLFQTPKNIQDLIDNPQCSKIEYSETSTSIKDLQSKRSSSGLKTELIQQIINNGYRVLVISKNRARESFIRASLKSHQISIKETQSFNDFLGSSEKINTCIGYIEKSFTILKDKLCVLRDHDLTPTTSPTVKTSSQQTPKKVPELHSMN